LTQDSKFILNLYFLGSMSEEAYYFTIIVVVYYYH